MKNLQGDIVAILDTAGNVVVSYVYDAWGRPINKTGSMAAMLGTVQPFRYRGYVYDEETGLFYLRNRYYSTATQRFINSDSMLGYNSIILQHNLFAYCVNSPIILTDTSGRNFFDDLWYYMCHRNDMMFWTTVAVALSVMGYPHSADLLVHSVQAKPTDLHFDDDDSITQTIMADAEFKAAITAQIDAGNFEENFSIVFEDNFDLFGALHAVTVRIKPVVVDGRPMYHVSIFDEYDFKYEEDYSSPSASVLRKVMVAGAIAGNNMAYASLCTGAIREYDIYIDFLYSEE